MIVNALLKGVDDRHAVSRLGYERDVYESTEADACCRLAVAREWLLSDGSMLMLLLSVVMATADGAEIDLNATLKKADAALYVAKEQGRCRLVVAS